jgi:hypothetical protein
VSTAGKKLNPGFATTSCSFARASADSAIIALAIKSLAFIVDSFPSASVVILTEEFMR